jgi:hypothetical protein
MLMPIRVNPPSALAVQSLSLDGSFPLRQVSQIEKSYIALRFAQFIGHTRHLLTCNDVPTIVLPLRQSCQGGNSSGVSFAI